MKPDLPEERRFPDDFSRRDDYSMGQWMGIIATKLDAVEKMLERVESGFGIRVTTLETRIMELEAARNKYVGQATLLASLFGVLGGFVTSFFQKHP